MRSIIIEDEEQAISALISEINRNCPELDIVGTAGKIKEAIDLIERSNPELIFLDIQLTDGLGFEILNHFEKHNFQIIFTTAYSQYAINAIKFSALDYLLKPINATELKSAVSRAKAKNKNELHYQIESFLKNQSLQNQNKKIALQTSQGIFIHEIQTIIKCTSEGNYTNIHFIDGKKLLISKPLKDFEDMLCSFGFERIHHSHIINLNHLSSYVFKDGGYVILTDKSTLPVSKRKKASLMDYLSKMNS
ncbi:response regulator transcription factor [Flavobacterium amnicola]|uniref:Response regulator transcription factor n=1 Tax=Flavobacterium amnicola TaxID=2506422 RepID=A0A4Q1K0Z0_9FLAO|nr:LytTR family DNA-binding domain-containing protein [Flavobacterium amnicola]RXR17880.1 response regulator transcription factor [Flavobacterium amnicola]